MRWHRVCCSVLQRVAECCSVLQVCCSVLQETSVLQHEMVPCLLQRVAACGSVLQVCCKCVAVCCRRHLYYNMRRYLVTVLDTANSDRGGA